ncbi:MAG: long-chain fatty acid--CoA ligase [Candidatus Calescibacterium sp.]|nr:long-chain fatty acid--CoA ligase [Candidatus Calescibacterium sp.]MDW8087072.1 long-chain fatty acid--CoA ligase [Candidatus Calescibacterium sp.]
MDLILKFGEESKIKNIPELFVERTNRSYGKLAYRYKEGDNWKDVTWGEFKKSVFSVASFLLKRGVKKGEKISVLSETKPAWCIADLAILSVGGTTVGLYPTLSPSQIEYIVNHSDSRAIFVENKEKLEKFLSVRKKTGVKEIIIFEPEGAQGYMAEDPNIFSLDQILKDEKLDQDSVEKRISEITQDDIALLVYTSGTTGNPKAAMISHGNILAFLSSFDDFANIGISEDDISYHFLPMAHVAEHIAGFFGRINLGLAAAYATSIKAVVDEIREVRPTIFGAVPRIFEKAYARIQEEVAKQPQRRQKIFRWAERAGREYVKHLNERKSIPLSLKIKYALAYNLVLKRVKDAFGGRIKYFITGAAPIPYEILEFMWACKLQIYEVYGLTEATVITHANTPFDFKLGTVGKPIKCVQSKLAQDGEILIKGPTVFKGYYKNEEATKEAIDTEGWLHTGDIGEIDKDGFLKIKDRKKHIIITSGGKNITPAEIENKLKAMDIIISQVHVHGDRRPYISAIITLNPSEAIEFAIKEGILDKEDEIKKARQILEELQEKPLARPEGIDEIMKKITSNPKVYERVNKAVERANSELSRVENIRKFRILERDFYIEEGEITPTLKVRRKTIEEKYKHIFDEMYKDTD